MNKNFKPLYPALILDLIVVISWFQILISDFILSYKLFIGGIIIFFTTVIFFINRSAYKILLLIVLLIAVTGIISFSNYNIIMGFGYIEIRLIPFFMLIFYLFVYQINIKELLIASDFDKNKNASLKEKFIKKFNNLSDEEIELKLKENLIPEAIEALKFIQNKRKTTINNVE